MPDVAAFPGEHAPDRVGLGVALERPWQEALGDQSLMTLHPGHVSIAEHGDPVRLEIERAARGRHDPLDRLQRQAVDEIEIDRPSAERARRDSASLRLLEGLLAADGSLHRWLQVLHPETDPGDAHGGESVAAIGRERRWVKLDRDLGVGCDDEALS
jgi:hypothetical protein